MTAPVVPHPIPPSLANAVRRISAEEYHLMIDKGIIADGAPYELLDGIIVNKDRARLGEDPMSHDPLHILAVNKIIRLVARIDSANRFVQIQLPIGLSGLYEPEPDASIIRGKPEDYRNRLPAPADVLCVIEAAHSSLDRDQEAKLAAYASAGIPQYIIVNLQANCVEVYLDPDSATSTYQTQTSVGRGQSLSLQLETQSPLAILVADLLP